MIPPPAPLPPPPPPPAPPPPPPPPPAGSAKVKDDADLAPELCRRLELEGRTPEDYTGHWNTAPCILQNGPQCGLVALCSAGRALGLDLEVADLMAKAAAAGASISGEMFSAGALARLASQCGLEAAAVTGLLSRPELVLRYLARGSYLLVPYDADGDHSPCLKKGHKAHWALVIGFLAPRRRVPPGDAPDGTFPGTKLVTASQDFHLESSVDRSGVYLVALHGKSQRKALWRYDRLEQSNAQLVEVDPLRCDPALYVLPPDRSLAEHLAARVVVIEAVSSH